MHGVQIREARVDDAEVLLALKTALDHETQLMMLEPGERPNDPGIERQAIERVMAEPNSVLFVADAGHELAGYLEARGGEYRRIRHTGYVVAGVRSGYRGQGIGKRLFEALDGWAPGAGIHRIELTVRVDNEPALRLYRRMGFEIEGTRRDSLRVNGEYVDEYLMARILPLDFAASDAKE